MNDVAKFCPVCHQLGVGVPSVRYCREQYGRDGNMNHVHASTVCDCGHTVTPSGVGTGYAVEQGTDRKICYACADEKQRNELRTADVVTAYLSDDGRQVTTWSGGKLGTVWQRHTSQRAHKTYVKVTDVHGAKWHGVGPAESGTYVTLRRSKS